MIREDRKYLSETDLLSMEKGVAKLDIHSIRINGKQNISKEIADSKIRPLMELLGEKFVIFQYHENINSYRDKWDLFFNGNKECLDSVRISFNSRQKSDEERNNDIKIVTKFLKEHDCEELDIAIQYTTNYNDSEVKEIVNNFIENNKNKFFFYMGMEGKIKQIDDNYYGFFKKKSRSRYYEIKDRDILGIALA
jgi:hypothetical protein